MRASRLFLVLTCALSLNGCISDDLDALQCLPGNILEGFGSPVERPGMERIASLWNLCGEDTCDDETPLAVGLERTAPIAVLGSAQDGAISIESSDPARLEVRTHSFRKDPCTGEGEPARRVGEATLITRAEGPVDLRVLVAGREVDRIQLVLARAARVEITHMFDSLAVGESNAVRADVRDARGHFVVVDQALAWSVDDVDTAALLGFDEESNEEERVDEVRDTNQVSVLGVSEGTTAVRVRFADVESTFDVHVKPAATSPK